MRLKVFASGLFLMTGAGPSLVWYDWSLTGWSTMLAGFVLIGASLGFGVAIKTAVPVMGLLGWIMYEFQGKMG